MNSPEVQQVLDGTPTGRQMYQAMQDGDYAQMQQLMEDPEARQLILDLMKQPALQEAMKSMHKNGNMQKMHEGLKSN